VCLCRAERVCIMSIDSAAGHVLNAGVLCTYQ